MTFRTRLITLFLASLGAVLPLVRAADSSAPTATANPRELVVSVVEPVDGRRGDADLYNRFARVFTTEFESRQWPLTLRIERFGANSPEHPIDLGVFLQPVRQELPDQWTFRAWVKLTVDGQPHDFGIIRSDLTPRPGQQMDDMLDHLVERAARTVADKLAPVLFPPPTVQPER